MRGRALLIVEQFLKAYAVCSYFFPSSCIAVGSTAHHSSGQLSIAFVLVKDQGLRSVVVPPRISEWMSSRGFPTPPAQTGQIVNDCGKVLAERFMLCNVAKCGKAFGVEE